MSEALLLANLVMVGLMSLERVLKAFECNLHSVRSVAFSSLCCAAEIRREATPPNTAAGSPAGVTPNPSAAFAPPACEERFRRGPMTLQELIDGAGPIETRRFKNIGGSAD